MNENHEKAAPDTGAETKKAIFSPRDWLGLGMALALAVLWFGVFGLKALAERRCVPAGLGTTLFVLALFGVTLIYLGRRAVWNRTTILLLAACLLMGINCAVYASPMTAAINCVFILCVGAMTIFALAGRLEKPVDDFRVIGNTVVLGVCALFSNMDKPFRALPSLGRDGKKRVGYAVLGIVIAVPVLALVIWLLSSADAVFGSLLGGFTGWLAEMDAGTALWHVLRTVVLGLMFASALYFLVQPGRTRKSGEASGAGAPPAMFIVVLALLDAVYIIFVAIQLAFLFGGKETAAMSGGYAEYARSGFFQLVAVAAINLGAVLISASASRPERGAKIAMCGLSTLLLALTAVILVSAAYRMRLYVSAYGLSFLRALTFWGMAVIALLMAAAAVKVFRRKFRFWPVLLTVVLVMWLAFSYANIDARVAEYNVDRYLDGSLEEVDVSYLSSFPEALPALRRLAAAEPEHDGVELRDVVDMMVRDGKARLNWRDVTVSAVVGR